MLQAFVRFVQRARMVPKAPNLVKPRIPGVGQSRGRVCPGLAGLEETPLPSSLCLRLDVSRFQPTQRHLPATDRHQ
jgi:hypothetical protein